MSTDGLALRPGRNGNHTLYAANHGDRMAIEVFEVDARPARPELRWIGCIELPARTLPNGVAVLPEGAFSGPNGVELSADGAGREIPLDFMPDNIHRLEDGSLLVGGQQASVQAIAARKAQCPQRWRVALVDPRKGSVKTLLAGPGTTVVNYAAGALAVDGTLYITVRGDRRIAFAPLSELPH